ncbi:dihydroorotate dehydrogenase (fumarate) [Austwickia chelonae]|uniref:Dihydroorotate dehydrogenase family protein n=1 Tax=Austwickia chelonae NBRC 105200 TaxID=1184607 RepID=K6VPR1_9MICO|nr:dihydroorotate dehydrogenase-like protein [Austwickia chelonae]GAB77360.1 dihydroorotate dehydrogenase family protein [Austwickia chelonae NBRC 105200]SEW08651.1 dihydroorotate dehydrogenase (fumarate) [Austwickia chelonae]
MADLSTRYLGLELRNPVVASAGPLSQNAEGVRRLAGGGVGAVVLFSLFEEQLRHEAARDIVLEELHEESFAESLSYFPTVPSNDSGLSTRYLHLLEESAAAVDIPVIASLNGSTIGSWAEFARQMQDAGAAAIELNVYLVPGDLGADGRVVEERHVEILERVKAAVSIPVAMKLSPYFSSFGSLALRLDQAGADGLVLFNRWIQPEIDIESVSVESGLVLSSRSEARLPQTWIATLFGRVEASLAGTTGVESADDVVRYLLAGADVVMSTSALVREGEFYAGELVDGLNAWLDRKGFTGVDAARGLLAVPTDVDASGYGRAGYVSALEKAKRTYGRVDA